MDKYEEALAKAWAGRSLEEIFPELKESEDERINNFIQNELACIRATEEKGFDRYVELTSAISYLEKQKEQKGANGNEKEIPNGQKPAEWSEKDELMRGTCIYLLEHDEVIGPWKNCIAWLKSLKNRGNPPKSNTNSPSWKPSEEQMNALYNILHPADPVNRDTVESLYNDLKKLL